MHHRAVTVDDNRPAERSFGSGLCSVNNHLHRRAYFRSTREPSFTYTLLGYAPLVQLRLYRAVRATVSNALVVSYWHKAEVFGMAAISSGSRGTFTVSTRRPTYVLLTRLT
jgi:hypothetical protein